MKGFGGLSNNGKKKNNGANSRKKNNGAKRGERALKVVEVGVPTGFNVLFGSGAPVSYGIKPKMSVNQNAMLEAALGSYKDKFDVRQYNVRHMRLDDLLKHGITHVVEGSIRGVYVDEAQNVSSFIFSLKLIDINDNRRIVSNQDRIQVQVQGYSEPVSYEDALREAVRQFIATF